MRVVNEMSSLYESTFNSLSKSIYSKKILTEWGKEKRSLLWFKRTFRAWKIYSLIRAKTNSHCLDINVCFQFWKEQVIRTCYDSRNLFYPVFVFSGNLLNLVWKMNQCFMKANYYRLKYLLEEGNISLLSALESILLCVQNIY